MIAETFRRSSYGKHIIAANILQDTLASQFNAATGNIGTAAIDAAETTADGGKWATQDFLEEVAKYPHSELR
jgi:hypothetical protein